MCIHIYAATDDERKQEAFPQSERETEMFKLQKKALALALSLILILGMLPMAAYANRSPNDFGHVEVRIDATVELLVDGVEQSIGATVVTNSVTIELPAGVSFAWVQRTNSGNIGSDTTLTSASGRLQEGLYLGFSEYGIGDNNGTNTARAYRGTIANDLDPKEFSISATLQLNEADLLAKVPYYESLLASLKDAVDGNYYLEIVNYHPDFNECVWDNTNVGGLPANTLHANGYQYIGAGGYDFYLDYTSSLDLITKGVLILAKEVVDEGGNPYFDSSPRTFTFRVEGPGGYAQTFSIPVLAGESGKEIRIPNLAPGDYSITETVPDGYSLPANTLTATVKTLSETNVDISPAVFTNTKLSDTGAISVKKLVTGADGTNKDYTFNLYAYDGGAKGALVSGPVTIKGDGTEERFFGNFPVGTYLIEEVSDGGADWTGVSYAGNAAVTTGGVVTLAAGTTVQVTATNNYGVTPPPEVGTLTIAKLVRLAGTEEAFVPSRTVTNSRNATESFEFQIILTNTSDVDIEGIELSDYLNSDTLKANNLVTDLHPVELINGDRPLEEAFDRETNSISFLPPNASIEFRLTRAFTVGSGVTDINVVTYSTEQENVTPPTSSAEAEIKITPYVPTRDSGDEGGNDSGDDSGGNDDNSNNDDSGSDSGDSGDEGEETVVEEEETEEIISPPVYAEESEDLTPPEESELIAPPVPTAAGNTLVLTDDGTYIEFDEDGVPLGEWRYDEDEDEWIFDEYPIPLGDIPGTGDAGRALPLLLLVGGCAGLALILTGKKRKD
jgi:hypothetical protein